MLEANNASATAALAKVQALASATSLRFRRQAAENCTSLIEAVANCKLIIVITSTMFIEAPSVRSSKK